MNQGSAQHEPGVKRFSTILLREATAKEEVFGARKIKDLRVWQNKNAVNIVEGRTKTI